MAETYKSGEKVKYRLAEAMKECMKKAPVEKITVKEITEECGVTRQTFYRNFQDKYDLINWYFDKILIESFEHMGEGQTVYESLVNKFQYIQKETLFFRAAFKNDDQNCLRDHDFRTDHTILYRSYRRKHREKDVRQDSLSVRNVLPRLHLHDGPMGSRQSQSHPRNPG